MRRHLRTGSSIAVALAVVLAAGALRAAESPLAVDSARVTIAGTSNVHDYTASTTKVRITRAQIGGAIAGTDFWANALKPGALEAFEIAIPAATLTSPREGLDKNMHKALKVVAHPEITFRLVRFEPGATEGAARAIGVLQIAGVEREVAVDIVTKRAPAGLSVEGKVHLLMTDFGVTPPKAMLGMLKTDPWVTVTFETVFTIPLT